MERKIKQVVCVVLAVLFGVLAIFSCLAWVNNSVIAVKWTTKAFHGEFKNNVESSSSKITGPIQWLDWSAVDYSTVTTLVLFFGFLLISTGFIRAVKAEGKALPEHFPFYKSYNALTVTLGLIGTVWGLIMIGYYKKPSAEDLVYCLHTALYSTLVALVWVYLIAMPMRYVMQRWYWYVSGVRKKPEMSGIKDLLLELGAAAEKTGLQMARLESQASGVGNRLAEAGKLLDEFKERTGVDAFGAIKGTLEKMAASAEQLLSLAGGMQAESQARLNVLECMQKTADRFKVAFEALRAAFESEIKARAQVESHYAEAQKRAAESDARAIRAESAAEAAARYAAAAAAEAKAATDRLAQVRQALGAA